MSGRPATGDGEAAAGTGLPGAARSVAQRLFAILDAFTEPGGSSALTLTALAQRAGLPLSTAHRLVGEWVRWGGLVREEDGRYTLGMRLWEVGVQAPTAHNLRTVALPYLEDLFERTREHVHLAILEGREALYLEKLSGHGAVPIVSRVGGRLPLHSTGVGLVLLAHAPPELVEDYLSRPLTAFLPQTVTSPGELRRRLAHIRHTGLAEMSEEMTAGSSSVAAPIRDRTNRVVAAVSTVTTTGKGSAADREAAVRTAARRVSAALGWRPSA